MTKRLTNEDYWEEHPGRATFLGIGTGWLIVITIMALAGITTLALWAGGVIFAPVKGRADAYKQQQSGTNRIAAQAHFHTLYGDILAEAEQLPQAYQNMQANPSSQFYTTNYTGIQAACLDAVNTYNQDSEKYLLRNFKDFDLPQTIDAVATCPTSPTATPVGTPVPSSTP